MEVDTRASEEKRHVRPTTDSSRPENRGFFFSSSSDSDVEIAHESWSVQFCKLEAAVGKNNCLAQIAL